MNNYSEQLCPINHKSYHTRVKQLSKDDTVCSSVMHIFVYRLCGSRTATVQRPYGGRTIDAIPCLFVKNHNFICVRVFKHDDLSNVVKLTKLYVTNQVLLQKQHSECAASSPISAAAVRPPYGRRSFSVSENSKFAVRRRSKCEHDSMRP